MSPQPGPRRRGASSSRRPSHPANPLPRAVADLPGSPKRLRPSGALRHHRPPRRRCRRRSGTDLRPVVVVVDKDRADYRRCTNTNRDWRAVRRPEVRRPRTRNSNLNMNTNMNMSRNPRRRRRRRRTRPLILKFRLSPPSSLNPHQPPSLNPHQPRSPNLPHPNLNQLLPLLLSRDPSEAQKQPRAPLPKSPLRNQARPNAPLRPSPPNHPPLSSPSHLNPSQCPNLQPQLPLRRNQHGVPRPRPKLRLKRRVKQLVRSRRPRRSLRNPSSLLNPKYNLNQCPNLRPHRWRKRPRPLHRRLTRTRSRDTTISMRFWTSRAGSIVRLLLPQQQRKRNNPLPRSLILLLRQDEAEDCSVVFRAS